MLFAILDTFTFFINFFIAMYVHRLGLYCILLCVFLYLEFDIALQLTVVIKGSYYYYYSTFTIVLTLS